VRVGNRASRSIYGRVFSSPLFEAHRPQLPAGDFRGERLQSTPGQRGRVERVAEMNCEPNLIFDVGMHRDEDTDFYLKKGFRVVSFEADPDLVEHCKRRFADQIARDQLNIIEGAIAPEQSEKNSFQELISEMDQLTRLGYKKFKIVQQKNIPNTKIVSHDVSGNEFEYIFENHSSSPFGEEIRQPSISYNKAIWRYRAIYMLYILVGDKTIFSQFGSHRNRITRTIQWSLRLPSAG
jgi:hypothetical protein